MITQREADRRVFQRKQDALHAQLREEITAHAANSSAAEGMRQVAEETSRYAATIAPGIGFETLVCRHEPWWVRG